MLDLDPRLLEPTPDDVEAPDPYATPTGLPLEDRSDPEARLHEGEVTLQQLTARTLFAALRVAPVNADELVRRAVNRVTNRPGYCQMECRLLAEIPALWPNASTAAQHAVGKHPRPGLPGEYAYWVGGAEGDGHVAVWLPNGLIRSTDAGGLGRWGTRSLDWFEANWTSLTYVGSTDNNNGWRVPGVAREWDEMATEAQFRQAIRDELGGPLSTLLERTDGLRVTLAQIAKTVEALDVELDGLARTEQVAKARTQIRALRNELRDAGVIAGG